jgi:3D (Asp-Asp-Asp) domain-containing protein
MRIRIAVFITLILLVLSGITGVVWATTDGRITLLSAPITGLDRYEPSAGWQTVQMRVTAYCPCEKCCGEYADGQTASGHHIQPGDAFVAADRKYPFGTEMVIPGYNDTKPVKVLDRGGAIKGDRLDLFFASHRQALEWGVRDIDVKVHSGS